MPNVYVKILEGTLYLIENVDHIVNVRDRILTFKEFETYKQSHFSLFRIFNNSFPFPFPLMDFEEVRDNEILLLFFHLHPVIRYRNLITKNIIEIEVFSIKNIESIENIENIENDSFVSPLSLLYEYENKNTKNIKNIKNIKLYDGDGTKIYDTGMIEIEKGIGINKFYSISGCRSLEFDYIY